MRILQEIYRFCLDFLFPRRCVGCGKEGKIWCEDCKGRVKKVERQVCHVCGEFSKMGRVHEACKKESNLDGLLVVASYWGNEQVRKAVFGCKYKFWKDVGGELGEMVLAQVQKEGLEMGVVVPVPLHWRRRWWRGFNQAEELGKVLSKGEGVKMMKALERKRNTRPQVKAVGGRRENVRGAFGLRVGKMSGIERCILVDDVMGTGATLEECAGVLKKGGVGEVWGVVVARG